MVREQRTDGSTLYVYNGVGSYEPLARLDTERATAKTKTLYYHTDVNGAPEELTDVNGKIVWRTEYQVWGNTIIETDRRDYEPRQNLRFQGQYLDRETGLHYNLNRYYDPDTGRFITPDPIGLAGGLNLYAYAPDPVNWIDPWGLYPESFGSPDQLLNHFGKHGAEFGAQSPEEYLDIGRGVIKNGYQVDYLYRNGVRTGYVQYMGNSSKGMAKFAFVGTNSKGDITTIHVKSGKEFWKMLNGNPKDKTIRPKRGGCHG